MFDIHQIAPQVIELPSGIKAAATFEPTAYAWSVCFRFHLTFYGKPTREDVEFAEHEGERIWVASYHPERAKRLPPPVV
jgi:hypothetical protein